ncbi:Bidirectional sugar transporter SWEET16 [Platanthera zijinensis]|uniref:Bidirectional sugar transporter SWEET n=1 Tax=Platanthera zijinensis TaxID=2320716 RepID=A0AAP0BP14_9ASPA
MEFSLLLLGIVGNIISVLVFASPTKTFWGIVKKRSTEEFEPTAYIVTFLNSSLWVYYGLSKPDGLLVATVNGAGVILEAVYISLFLLYASRPDLRVKTATLVAVVDIGLLLLVIGITSFGLPEGMRLAVIGGICVCLNILMYASPLAIIRTVIRTKSVEFMPFLLSFFLFLNGGVWLLYAIFDSDIFLGISNGLGFIFGTIQLILYKIYMKSKTSKTSAADIDGKWQHAPLLQSAQGDEEEANFSNS